MDKRESKRSAERVVREIEFTHPCSSLFSTHTHAKHRLIIVTQWPSNRCCEQCGSQATPALLSSAPSSTSFLVHAVRPRETQFLPLPLPSHVTSEPGLLHVPHPPSWLFICHLRDNNQVMASLVPKDTRIQSWSLSAAVHR